MAKSVKMLRQPRGRYEGNAFPAVGEVAEFSDDVARTLVHFKYAEPVSEDAPESPEKPEGDTPEGANPAAGRDKATADKRETRNS